MKKTILLLFVAVFIAACSSVMLTGRKQLNLVSDSEVNQMSFQSYKELIDSVPLSTNKTNTAMVKKVGTKIASAVETYMKANGYEKDIANFAWEYNLLKDEQVNAFCMPGGKVAVYEGILPVTQNETGMAVVIGHEVAHAVARHSSERLSQQILAQYGSSILGAAFSTKSAAIQQGIGTLYGIGAQLTILKYSRKQESEADRLGLIFMAMAGYDPNQSLSFWQRMAAQSTGSSTPEFLSTHPSDEQRIADIKKELPEALKYYKK
ncbi:Peptidase M48 Ste24p [uncultured Paludibacter sp.]|uniref:Peptidase M48 Ste24p n=1 Tax=uncultured Paludibacter sp. TaxID=497635 RepID=A0A653AGT8_9BACT|nr:Peptidase M48 Ste24p [uncultured Paludibacter sp.]